MLRLTGAGSSYYIVGLENNLEQQVGMHKSIDVCAVTRDNQLYIEQ